MAGVSPISHPFSRMISMSDRSCPLVSVVVANYNGAQFLRGCLDSLRMQTYPRIEVIVVDDASADGSVDLVRAEYPEIHLVVLPRNVGFAAASNEGMRQSAGQIIALLNNDAEADSQWVAELVAALRDDPAAGIAASKILLYDRRDVIHTAGDFLGRNGRPGNRGVWQHDGGQFDTPGYVFGGCGGAVAYRREMLDDIGLFDETFFMYCEDVDLSFRAQLRGYRVRYVPTARVYHRLSATGGGVLASYYSSRNSLAVLVKNMPTSLLWRMLPRLLWAQARMAAHAIWHFREPAARASLRGQLAGLRLVPSLLPARRVIQERRTVPDHYVWSILS